MPNIKSAKKRVVVTEKKNLENRMIKSQINTTTKKFEALVAAKNVKEAEEVLKEVVAVMDSAVSKHVIHKNTASRKQARLNVLLNTIR